LTFSKDEADNRAQLLQVQRVGRHSDVTEVPCFLVRPIASFDGVDKATIPESGEAVVIPLIFLHSVGRDRLMSYRFVLG
jgi:hypothetical protein